MKTSIKVVIFTFSLFASIHSFSQFHNASLVQGAKSYVQIDWSLDNNNLSHFIIERSLDGKNFKQCALVFASEDASFSDYKFRDKEITDAAIVYYRIASVNSQKEISYFPVRKVVINNTSEQTTVGVYPNPVDQQMVVDLPASWKSKAVEIQIFSIQGDKVQSVNVREAKTSEKISVENLRKGNYILKAYCGSETIESMIIKK